MGRDKSGELRFLVATPICDTHGPRKAYLQIRRAIDKRGLLREFALHTLWAVGAGHPIVKKLGEMMAGRDVLLTNFDADGFSTDYLYLYLLKRTGRPPGRVQVIRPVKRKR